MPVSCDPLMLSSPDSHGKVATRRTPDAASAAEQREGPSFADHYLRERQQRQTPSNLETRTSAASADTQAAVTENVEKPAAQATLAGTIETSSATDDDVSIPPGDGWNSFLLLGLGILPATPEPAAMPPAESVATAPSTGLAAPSPTVTSGLWAMTGGVPSTTASSEAETDGAAVPDVATASDTLLAAPDADQAGLRSKPELPGKPGSGLDALSKAVEGETAEAGVSLTSDDSPTEGAAFDTALAAAIDAAPAEQQGRDESAGVTALRASAAPTVTESGAGTRAAAPSGGQPPLAMQQAGWSESVVDRVMWMSSQNLQSAEIQLDPLELGRMEVRIELVKDQAQVTFLSPHAGVRDALEGQLPRLREMFGQQGLNLLDVNVSDQSQARDGQGGWRQQQADSRGSGRGSEGEVSSLGSLEVSGGRLTGGRGLVDYYA